MYICLLYADRQKIDFRGQTGVSGGGGKLRIKGGGLDV